MVEIDESLRDASHEKRQPMCSDPKLFSGQFEILV